MLVFVNNIIIEWAILNILQDKNYCLLHAFPIKNLLVDVCILVISYCRSDVICQQLFFANLLNYFTRNQKILQYMSPVLYSFHCTISEYVSAF